MNNRTPFIYFIITFVISMYCIKNIDTFRKMHTSDVKMYLTMSLIISIIVFIMAAADYYCEK